MLSCAHVYNNYMLRCSDGFDRNLQEWTEHGCPITVSEIIHVTIITA